VASRWVGRWVVVAGHMLEQQEGGKARGGRRRGREGKGGLSRRGREGDCWRDWGAEVAEHAGGDEVDVGATLHERLHVHCLHAALPHHSLPPVPPLFV